VIGSLNVGDEISLEIEGKKFKIEKKVKKIIKIKTRIEADN
jgi:hypothetical protein